MSRILLVSEDELTSLAHQSKLDVLSRVNEARAEHSDLGVEELLLLVQAEVLSTGSGFDPFAVDAVDPSIFDAPVEEIEEEEIEEEEEPEGESFFDPADNGQLLEVIEEPAADEPEPEPEADETPIAYSEFDAARHTEDESRPPVEEEAPISYNTPVFPEDVLNDAERRQPIDRRRLAREVAQIDRDE